MSFKSDEQRKAVYAALRQRFSVRVEPAGMPGGASFRLAIHDKGRGPWLKQRGLLRNTTDIAHTHNAYPGGQRKNWNRIAEIDIHALQVPFGDKWGRVAQAWVSSDYRGQRVGTALYLLAYKHAKKRGMLGLASVPTDRNSSSDVVWNRLRSDQYDLYDLYLSSDPTRSKLDVMNSLQQHRYRRGQSLKEKRKPKQRKLF